MMKQECLQGSENEKKCSENKRLGPVNGARVKEFQMARNGII